MKSVSFGSFFEGAVSVEQGDGWFKPWRLPHDQRLLFPSPDEGLLRFAAMSSGVRLRCRTDARRICLDVAPLEAEQASFDVTIENEIVASVTVALSAEQVVFDDLPAGDKVLEIWLPPGTAVAIRDMRIEDQATCEAAPDLRPRWVTYGSSLTHCVRATSAARIWPAIVARVCDLHVTALGFGGQCHIDPMVGRVIRDLPADYITLKMGINVMGSGSLNLRTFAANMLGFVQIIREKHPQTPLALVTSFCSTPRETTPNAVGMTLEIMRAETRDVYRRLRESGDQQVFLAEGPRIVDAASIEKYASDQLHHNGEGIEEIAARWIPEVMHQFGLGL